MNPDKPEWVSVMDSASLENPWFTKDNIYFSLKTWHEALQPNGIDEWLKPLNSSSGNKNIGIVMAGNIPMVGLHDLLCVLATGNTALVKLSSSDTVLMKECIRLLNVVNASFGSRIQLIDRIENADSVIATGSNNSSRYFEYYFRNMPSLIRKSRTGVAILNGEETQSELKLLGEDCFRYFGMGCRNVTHLWIPESYAISDLLDQWTEYSYLIDHHKYANNYTYHKAIFLMNLDAHFDTGFVLLKEDSSVHAPVGCIFFQRYSHPDEPVKWLEKHRGDLQVIVGNITGGVPFGSAQHTGLSDYADNINTLEFLLSLE